MIDTENSKTTMNARLIGSLIMVKINHRMPIHINIVIFAIFGISLFFLLENSAIANNICDNGEKDIILEIIHERISKRIDERSFLEAQPIHVSSKHVDQYYDILPALTEKMRESVYRNNKELLRRSFKDFVNLTNKVVVDIHKEETSSIITNTYAPGAFLLTPFTRALYKWSDSNALCEFVSGERYCAFWNDRTSIVNSRVNHLISLPYKADPSTNICDEFFNFVIKK
ncbi:hypothetical protein [Azospirillum agricola]|uniref:hypothetical protein n=1 Tax=Azospirillum agricola TaxID=1720247 RepID=UPI000A0F2BF3|nr:hypothetical protein [Azospirillum agricola]SMH30516.1 hypothetical protein SAMN02982994_0323 [Azospirillum lipoferum]